MKKKTLVFAQAVAIFLSFVTPIHALGAITADNVIECGEIAGIFERAILMIFGLSGIVFFIVLIMGGAMFVLSAGNPEGIQKARQTLMWGVIGTLISSLMVFLTTSFLTDVLGVDGLSFLQIEHWMCNMGG